MPTLHMTEADLVRDIASVLNQVQAGAEIIIERNATPVAVIRAAQQSGRPLSEIIAGLSKYSLAPIDPDFAADVREFIDGHPEPLKGQGCH